MPETFIWNFGGCQLQVICYVPVNCMTFPKVKKFMKCLNGIKYIRADYNNVSIVFRNNKNFWEGRANCLLPFHYNLKKGNFSMCG